MGNIDVSYAELVKEFGEPTRNEAPSKTDAEWVISTPAGVATIYNYKDGINYLGSGGKKAEDIRDWHIGGHEKSVVAYISKLLGKETGVDEAKELVEKRAQSIVDERILPEAYDAIAEWSGTLMGEMATLTDNDDQEAVHEIFFNGLIKELIKQLYERQK